MTKQIHRETTIITDLIETDNGQIYIVGRSKNTNIQEKRVFEGEIPYKYSELHRQHSEDIAKETLPSLADQSEAGEEYALKSIVELHGHEKAGEFEVKGIWWEMTLNYLKNKGITFIVGVLKGLIKDQIPNMIKLAVWLIEQLENILIEQYKQIESKEIQSIIKNELNQYEQLKPLAEKLK